jgi:co-chaperonin GroES (HSP10)
MLYYRSKKKIYYKFYEFNRKDVIFTFKFKNLVLNDDNNIQKVKNSSNMKMTCDRYKNDFLLNELFVKGIDVKNLFKELLNFLDVDLFEKWKKINYINKHIIKQKIYFKNKDDGLRLKHGEMIFYSSFKTNSININNKDFEEKLTKAIHNDIINLIKYYYDIIKNVNDDDYILYKYVPLKEIKLDNEKYYYYLELNLNFMEWFTYKKLNKKEKLKNQ